MLTPEEKWFFDHHGFIILRQVVPPEDIQLMIELGNRWHNMTLEELPPPLTSTSRSSTSSPTIAHWINNVQYGDAVFQRLVLIVDPENKFTFSVIYVSVYDYGIFNRWTQTRA